MLFRIRSKLLLYFTVLVVLLSSIGFFFYKSMENLVIEYDDSFQRFLLLNDITQRTNQITEKLNAYLLEKEHPYLSDYLDEKEKLLSDKNRLYKEMDPNDIAVTNYQNMIDSFLEESDNTIEAFHNDQINVYSTRFNEVLKISTFLQETTLALINDKLTTNQKFYDQMEKKNRDYKLMSISLFASTFFLSTLLALWISGGITKPIRLLSIAALDIAKGNLSGEDIKITTKDELKPLTDTFNQMRTNLHQLVQEIKQKSELDQLLKELELRSLQNQINPHFLFNTLNVVSKMAYLEEAEQTKKLIESIATLLRYNLGDFKQVSTLREEVRIVKEYFFIQQTRFGERIEFITDIEDDCLDIEVPCLILQPLIENAFIHGVESFEENGVIHLRIYRNNDRIYVEVIDNGEGMDEQTKNKLLGYMHQISTFESYEVDHPKDNSSTGIGIRNVIRRLQLFYHRNDIAEIESAMKKGTNFRLLIPDFSKGGEEIAENTHCG